MNQTGYTFNIEQLRRLENDEQQSSGASALQIGGRLARLAAEAPVGVTITIHSRGVGGRLHTWITVTDTDLQEPVPGCPPWMTL